MAKDKAIPVILLGGVGMVDNLLAGQFCPQRHQIGFRQPCIDMQDIIIIIRIGCICDIGLGGSTSLVFDRLAQSADHHFLFQFGIKKHFHVIHLAV